MKSIAGTLLQSTGHLYLFGTQDIPNFHPLPNCIMHCLSAICALILSETLMHPVLNQGVQALPIPQSNPLTE